MKVFVGVTDNDWFAFLFTATTFTENSPPEGRRINFEPKSVNLSIRYEVYTLSLSYYL